FGGRGGLLGRSRFRGRRLRIDLRLLRRLFAMTAAVLIVMRALRWPSAVVVDAWYRNRPAIGIDADGTSTIFEGVLSLRGGTRQQQRGDRNELFHHDLLSRLN